MFDKIAWYFESRKIINESNLDKLALDKSDNFYVNRFNNDVVKQIEEIFNHKAWDTPNAESAIYPINNELKSLEKSLDILELEIMTSSFYYDRILTATTEISKDQISNIIHIAEELLTNFKSLENNKDNTLQEDINSINSTLYRINRELNDN